MYFLANDLQKKNFRYNQEQNEKGPEKRIKMVPLALINSSRLTLPSVNELHIGRRSGRRKLFLKCLRMKKQ